MSIPETPEARLFRELSPLSALPGFAGALLLTENLALLENQLPLSDDKVVSLALPLLQLRQGMSQASRRINFLLVRLQSEQYALVPIETGLMLIRLSVDADLDLIRRTALTVASSLKRNINEISQMLIGEIFFSDASKETPVAISDVKKEKAEEEVIGEKNDDSDPQCEEYLKKVRSLLARVASASQVDRMFTEAFKEVGAVNKKLRTDQIANFSEVVVKSIRNPARQKMVAKEMLIVAKKLGL